MSHGSSNGVTLVAMRPSLPTNSSPNRFGSVGDDCLFKRYSSWTLEMDFSHRAMAESWSLWDIPGNSDNISFSCKQT